MSISDHPLVLDLGHIKGSQWYHGTALTHTSGSATGATGIGHAGLRDIYLNTETGCIYQCTIAGAPETAQWTFLCNVTGAKGDKGNKGDKGDPGTSFSSGDGDPDDETGNDGDMYLDLTTLTIYVRSNGEWGEAPEQPFHPSSVDLSSSMVETRTQEFFDKTAIPGTHACLHKVGNVVTLYLNRPNSATHSYDFHTETVDGVVTDGTHNFGVILPEGYRPAHQYVFPMRVCYAMADPGVSQNRFAIGWGRIDTDGKFGIAYLQKFNSQDYSSSATIYGLEVSFTYVVGGADAAS